MKDEVMVTLKLTKLELRALWNIFSLQLPFEKELWPGNPLLKAADRALDKIEEVL